MSKILSTKEFSKQIKTPVSKDTNPKNILKGMKTKLYTELSIEDVKNTSKYDEITNKI